MGQVILGGSSGAARSVETPRGRYVIQGHDIVLVDAEGVSDVAYSTVVHAGRGQRVGAGSTKTTRLDSRELTTAPPQHRLRRAQRQSDSGYGHPGSRGGRPQWSVDPARRGVVTRPSTSPSPARQVCLLSNGGFWTTALALSLSMVGVALAASQYLRRDLPWLARISLVSLALLVGLPIVLVMTGQEYILEQILTIALGSSVLLVFALIGGAHRPWLHAKARRADYGRVSGWGWVSFPCWPRVPCC